MCVARAGFDVAMQRAHSHALRSCAPLINLITGLPSKISHMLDAVPKQQSYLRAFQSKWALKWVGVLHPNS